MIIHHRDVPEQNGRQGYPVTGAQHLLHHLAVRVTTPANPFLPHRHEAEEIWYIVEGEARVIIDGQEHIVGAGDLIILSSWVEHGLAADERTKWICVG